MCSYPEVLLDVCEHMIKNYLVRVERLSRIISIRTAILGNSLFVNSSSLPETAERDFARVGREVWDELIDLEQAINMLESEVSRVREVLVDR